MLARCIHAGITTSGIMAPPVMDMVISTAQPRPDTARGVDPLAETTNMIPVSAQAAEKTARASSGAEDGRTWKKAAPSASTMVATVRIAISAAKALAARICARATGAIRSRTSVPRVRSFTSAIANPNEPFRIAHRTPCGKLMS